MSADAPQGDLDDLTDKWLSASGAAATTRSRHRRALVDWAGWLTAQDLDPFGPHIEEAIAEWEADMASRLAEDTAVRRSAAVSSFYEWCDDNSHYADPQPRLQLTDSPSPDDTSPDDDPPSTRGASLRAAILEFNARQHLSLKHRDAS